MAFNMAPAELGRGIIIGPDQDVPPEFATTPVFDIDTATVQNPEDAVDKLHLHWVNREPVVIRLHVSPADLKNAARETNEDAPWKLGPGFLFHGQRLHFLAWNNNWDFRTGEAVWWWANKAIALGASAATNGEGDVVVNGSAVYCDGGPVQPLDVASIPYTNIQVGSLAVIQNARSGAELAPDQSEAVHHRGGPARIIAPAGSGKTRVLTERLRHVLNDWRLAPKAVGAVAYNTRAAAELTERTGGLPASIRTLNSLALAIVSGNGGFMMSALESSRRDMINERDVRSILQNLVELPRRSNSDPTAAWIEALSSVRLGLVDPNIVEETSGDLAGFGDVFDRYRAALADRNLLDFDEQIYRAIEILLRDARAREVAQQQCRMLLVDEFQDLTPAHVLMLRLLASPALDVFGVGDDDQVIYGYAGADPDYLVRFGDWFPGAQSHALEVNYRCPPAVVTSASNLLTRNGVRVDKTIRARPGRDVVASELQIERLGVERLAPRAIELIESYIDAGKEPGDIALLTRVNVTLLPVQVLLSELSVPHTTAVDAALLKRTGIRTALAYLRMGADLDRLARADITDTVRRPSRKIARNVVDMMTKRSRTSIRDLRSLAAGLSGSDGPKVDEYVQDLALVANAVQNKTTADALDVIQNRIGLGDVMDVLDKSRGEADRSTHADDLAALNAVAHLHPDAASFEKWLNGVLSRVEVGGGIELATVHRVKGREWDNVIVYDASDGLLPHRLSNDRSEERRVFHVALTRARNQSVVLANQASPSPFLLQLDEPGEPEVVRKFVREERPAAGASKVDEVHAEVGLTISLTGGTEGTIVDVDNERALVSVGKARVSVAYGDAVRVSGKLATLAAPRDERTERAVEALKVWRRTTASELSVPAYTIFHDAHLEGIASRNPTTLAQLAKCKGVGETKLERWGDDILTVLETAAAAPV